MILYATDDASITCKTKSHPSEFHIKNILLFRNPISWLFIKNVSSSTTK